MNRVVYGTIALAGIVIALLEYFLGRGIVYALSILLIDIYILGLLYLFTEWRYYRNHNALLASIQFIAVPAILLLLGNFLAPRGIGRNFINFSIGLFGRINASSSLVSLLLIIPSIIFLQLSARYYDGRYPGFVVRRRQFGPKFFPIIIHISTVAGLIATGIFVGIIDVVAFLFIISTLIQWIQKFVIPVFQSSDDGQVDRERRGFLNSILGGGNRRRRRRRSSVSPSSRSDFSSSSSSSSSRGSSSSSSRRSSSSNRSSSRRSRRRRDIPTSPSDGYREIPTRSRNSSPSSDGSSSSSRSSAQRSPRSRKSAEIDKGIEAITPAKRRKVKKSKISNYLPNGNYEKSDLSCMVCYEEFRDNSRKNIVICPNCKFPAHEVEFKSWLRTSDRCPRCNQEVSNNRKLNKGLVSESQYAKFIKKL